MTSNLMPCPFCHGPAEEVEGKRGWFSCADNECPAWQVQALAEDWNRRANQPAAAEPKQQTAINADDLPTKKYPLGAFDFDSPAAGHVAAGEPIQVEAVAVTREDEDGLYLDWVLEGGISALEAPGVVLLVAHGEVTDRHGSGEVYLAPPAAAHGDEAVRKDAARYQWLRNRLPGSDYRVAGIVYSEGGEGVDEAIDAAMRAQAGEGGEG